MKMRRGSFSGLSLAVLAPMSLMLAAGALGTAAPALADAPKDARVSEVYAAARSGQVDKALEMMSQVLKDHPNSAKAHYVDAELLARQHRYAEAKAELATAEKLSPGLPGIAPQSVYALKAQLNGTGTAARDEAPVRAAHGFPWGPVLLIGVALFALLAFLRRRNRAEDYQPPMGGSYNPSGPYGPQGGGYPPQGYAQPGYPPQSGGLGSGILGGLATGAAAGVGIAAGERLVDGLFGGREREHGEEHDEPRHSSDDGNTDMGGNDFGIGDDSWDSGSSNDDW